MTTTITDDEISANFFDMPLFSNALGACVKV
jgi:hypothetical protein